MEKAVLNRRLEQMEAEGTRFVNGCNVGVDITVEELREANDAVVLALGSTAGRDLPAPGRDLEGIHLAMEYLEPSNHVQEGDIEASPVVATGKHVVIIGGGDTGADCLGTAHRQGAQSVVQLEIMPRPPDQRADSTPWPTWPLMFRVSSAHEEGGDRLFSVSTKRFIEGEGESAGRIRALELAEVLMVDGRFEEVDGTAQEIPADLVLLAMGFTGPVKNGMIEQLGVELEPRGNVAVDADYMSSVGGVFAAGDMRRGQSLVVWAIAEGRKAAEGIDRYLRA
jgi:glutamate synthase (NADPH/NADH) small chain